MSTLAHPHRQSPPTVGDATLARLSGQRLAPFARGKTPITVKVSSKSGQEQPIELPVNAVKLLLNILEAMASGRGVTIIPENAELTTVEAASLLNVSRPYLIKLLDEKAIPHRLVGKHRRILMDDVMTYKQRIDAEREEVLAQLTADAQEQDMGYARL